MCWIIIRPPNDFFETQEEKYPLPRSLLSTGSTILIFDRGVPRDTFASDYFTLGSVQESIAKGIYSIRKITAQYELNTTGLTLISDNDNMPLHALPDRPYDGIQCHVGTIDYMPCQTVESFHHNLPDVQKIQQSIQRAKQQKKWPYEDEDEYSLVYVTFKNVNMRMQSVVINSDNNTHVLSMCCYEQHIQKNNGAITHHVKHYSWAEPNEECKPLITEIDIHDLFVLADNFTLSLIKYPADLTYFRKKLYSVAANFMERFNDGSSSNNIHYNYVAFMLLMNYIHQRDKKEQVEQNAKFETLYSALEADFMLSEKERQQRINLKKIRVIIIYTIIGIGFGFFVAQLAFLLLTAFFSLSSVSINLAVTCSAGIINGYRGLRFFNQEPPKREWEEAMDNSLKLTIYN